MNLDYVKKTVELIRDILITTEMILQDDIDLMISITQLELKSTLLEFK